MSRPRLLERAADSTKPLVIISAGAGYGKTTLMTQMHSALKGVTVWYQMDGRDRDLIVLLSHLVQGIEASVPGFGKSVSKQLRRVSNPDLEKETVLTVLICEMAAKIKGQALLFFDDFHCVNESTLITASMKFMIANLPEGYRVFIGSREKPNLQLSRLRSQRALTEIGERDLRFTHQETESLFSGAGLRGTRRRIHALRELTDGWPAMLVLARSLMIKEQKKIASLNRMARAAARDYLEEQVWAGLDHNYRRFFMEASLLETVEPEICDRALNMAVSSSLLRTAAEKNLVTMEQETANAYRFHPLFREFLMMKLESEMGRARRRDLNRAYARAYREKGRTSNALDHYLAAGDLESAAAAISESKLEVLQAGRSQNISALLRKIPPELFATYPWLSYYRSQTEGWHENPDDVLKTLALAEAAFKRTGDRKGRFVCAMTRGEILFYKAEHRLSLEAFSQAHARAGNPEERIDATNRLAVQNLLLGKTGKSRRLFAAASGLCVDSFTDKRLTISISMLNLAYCSGDFGNLTENTEKLMGNARQRMTIQDRFTLFLHRILALFEAGRYRDSLDVLDEAESLLSRKCQGLAPAFGCLRGQSLIFGGDSAGRRLIMEAVKRTTKSRYPGPGCAILQLGAWERHRGNFDQALAIHSRALRTCRDEGNPYATANALQQAGADRIRMAGAGSADGRSELEEAFETANKGGYEYIKSQVHFHLAWLAQRNGDINEAASRMESCLELASRYRHDHFMVQEGRANIDLMTLAYAQGIERGYLADIFRQMGTPCLDGLKALLDSPDAELRRSAIPIFTAVGGSAAMARIRKMTRDSSLEIRQMAEAALEKMRSAAGSPEEILTGREMEVLELMSRGLGNLEISNQLYISEATVKTHASRIFNKLGLNKRSQAIALYHEYFSQSPP
ncbi:MAG: hypothetical protein IBX61_08795 [Thermoleophilia bacterium]|nr:hypothetical protein [Thermoleophilia bacterium]